MSEDFLEIRHDIWLSEKKGEQASSTDEITSFDCNVPKFPRMHIKVQMPGLLGTEVVTPPPYFCPILILLTV